MADAPKLLGTDTLRTAYPKVNMAIDNANEALRNSEEALNTANQALTNSENTQAQLDQIVIEGDSSVEAAQARVDAVGNVFTTLKERLDTKETQFANEIGILNKKTDGVVSVKEFGAKGDGVTDDSSAIQSALDYLKSKGGGILYFPKATYLVKQPLFVATSNIIIDGGMSTFITTGFTSNGFYDSCLFFVGSTDGTIYENIVIRHIHVDDFYGHSIKVKNVNRIHIHDNIFTNGHYESIFIGKSSYVWVENNYIDGSTVHGISFDAVEGGENVPVSHWVARNNIIKNCANFAIDGHSAAGTYGRIEDNVILNCGMFFKNQLGMAYVKGNIFVSDSTFVSTIQDVTSLVFFQASGSVFKDNYIELNGSHAESIIVKVPFVSDGERITIEGNTIIQNNPNESKVAISVYSTNGKVRNSVISRNKLKSVNGDATTLTVRNLENSKIEDNIFDINLTGSLTTGSYYVLFFDTYIKNVDFNRNIVLVNGTINAVNARIVFADGVSNGYVRFNDNAFEVNLTGTGTKYLFQFIGGTGHKRVTNNICLSIGDTVFSSDVVQTNNYFPNQRISIV